MSSFSGLTNASRSLNAAQYALSITGENITNANTTGYVRQRADLTEVSEPQDVSRIYAVADPSDGGVDAKSASRLNDAIVDARQRTEHGLDTYAQTKADALSQVETTFDEPSDTGLGEQLSDLWNNFASLANSPGGGNSTAAQGVRDVVITQAGKLVSSINSAATQLANVATSVTTQLSQTVTKVNTAATQLAAVNKQIAYASANGTDYNSLADQRDQLTLQLAELTGATATIETNGAASVSLPTSTGTVKLVDGTTPLAAPAVLSSATTTTGGVTTTTISVGATAISTASGNLQGNLDSLTAVAGYQSQLNTVAKSLADTVNAQQQAGTDFYGQDSSTTPAVSNLFNYTAGNEAATLSLATTDPSALAAAAAGQSAGSNDGSNAAIIARNGTLANGPDALYSKMIGDLGTASSSAAQAATVQAAVTTNIDNLQQSAAGVNMDEETTNMLVYQRMYQASARVLNTVDDMLDQLINHTGRVGL